MKKWFLSFFALLLLVSCAGKLSKVENPTPSETDLQVNFETALVEEVKLSVAPPPSEFMANASTEDTTVRWIQGIPDPQSITPHVLKEIGLQSVVNKYNALPEGYEPPDLTPIQANFDGWGTLYLRKEAAENWNALEKKATEAGLTLVVFSAWRSQETQENLFNGAYGNDPLEALSYTAMPRRSEHEMGLALDVGFSAGFPDHFYDHPEGIFLREHAADYGFVLRYPEGKETITGYGYESWHFRYVGKRLAMQLKKKDLTLEEYYGLVPIPGSTPTESSALLKQIRVKEDFVNVRREPSAASEWLGRLEAGETIGYTEEKDGWFSVLFQGETSWVSAEYVEKIEE